MTGRDMELLTFSHVGLSTAEASLVATLFRLHGVDRSFIWTLDGSAPFDALLVDSTCQEDDYLHLTGPHTRIIRLAPHGETVEDAMPRPIRSDQLLTWLNRVEIVVLHGNANPFASTLQHSQAPKSTLRSIFGLIPEARLTVRKQEPATPARTAWVPPQWEARDARTTYKLKRWPSIALIKNDPGKVRVATMASRRALTLSALAELSRIPSTNCESWLLEWAQLGLIEFGQAEPPASRPTAAPEPQVTEPTTRQGFGASLIHSIRRRFGIL